MATNQAKSGVGSSGLSWWMLVLVLLVAAGAYWLGQSRHAKSPGTHVVVAPACKLADLSLSQGATEGTAGTLYKHAVITNHGSTICKLVGYPAVFLLDSHGAVLGTGAAPNPLYPVATVNVSAGGAAHVILAFPEADNFTEPGICTDKSTQLQMYLPGELTPLTTAWSDHSCPGFTVTTFQGGS